MALLSCYNGGVLSTSTSMEMHLRNSTAGPPTVEGKIDKTKALREGVVSRWPTIRNYCSLKTVVSLWCNRQPHVVSSPYRYIGRASGVPAKSHCQLQPP